MLGVIVFQIVATRNAKALRGFVGEWPSDCRGNGRRSATLSGIFCPNRVADAVEKVTRRKCVVDKEVDCNLNSP